jgi:SNF2 family DNA or RNA helicase
MKISWDPLSRQWRLEEEGTDEDRQAIRRFPQEVLRRERPGVWWCPEVAHRLLADIFPGVQTEEDPPSDPLGEVENLTLSSPLEHQLEGAGLLLSGKVLCGDEMGLGKTYTTILAWMHLYARDEVDNLLVICPKRVIRVWEEEFRKHLGFLHPNVRITNYDLTFREPHKTSLLHFVRSGRTVLVLDECHHLSNEETKRFRSIRLFALSAARIWGLTGSPVRRGPSSFIGVYKALTGASLTDRQFRAIYDPLGDGRYRNVEDLEWVFRRIGFRRLKSEVASLPPLELNQVVFEMTGRQRELYEQMRQHFYAELKGLNDQEFLVKVRRGEIRAQLTRLLQLLSHPGLLGDNISDEEVARLKVLDELLAEAGEQKVVVWSRHPWILEKLAQRYPDRKPAVVHGQMTDRQVEESLRRFLQEPDCLLLCSSILAYSEGVNLQVAGVSIYYDLTLRFDKWIHSQHRLHRVFGTRGKVSLYVLVAADSVDSFVLENLMRKQVHQALITGTGDDLLKTDLLRALSPRKK